MVLTESAKERIGMLRKELAPRFVMQLDSRLQALRQLAGKAKLHIHVDREPASFLFFIESVNGSCSLNGALVWHGSAETGGYRDGGSIQLVPRMGYQIHT